VEVQVHRNLGQEQREHYRTIRGAAEAGKASCPLPPTSGGYRKEAEVQGEVSPYVVCVTSHPKEPLKTTS